MLVLVSGLLAIAQLFLLAAATNAAARHVTLAATLAAQKVEQLRGLRWSFDAGGVRVSDLASDTAAGPESTGGGTGLQPSPPGALERNTPGYVDHVDGYGRTVGRGDVPPPNAVYTRRWSIEPLSGDGDTLMIRVLVARSDRSQNPRTVTEAQVVTIRTRTRP